MPCLLLFVFQTYYGTSRQEAKTLGINISRMSKVKSVGGERNRGGVHFNTLCTLCDKSISVLIDDKVASDTDSSVVSLLHFIIKFYF